MRGATVNILLLRLDKSSASQTLSVFSDVSDRPPEFGGRLLGLLNSGEELFFINDEVRTAPGTGDLVAGFKPSDSRLNLVSAFGASHPDSLIVKHLPHPFRSDNCNITSEGVQ